MNDISIEFKAMSKNGIIIAGYVYESEIEDEHPLNFYDKNGFEDGSRVPLNPYSEDDSRWEDYEKLSSAFQSDELLLQFLSDFAEEDKSIDRGNYILIINNGDNKLYMDVLRDMGRILK